MFIKSSQFVLVTLPLVASKMLANKGAVELYYDNDLGLMDCFDGALKQLHNEGVITYEEYEQVQQGQATLEDYTDAFYKAREMMGQLLA